MEDRCPYCDDVDPEGVPPGVDVVNCLKCDGWYALTDGVYDAERTRSLGLLVDALNASAS